MAQWLSEDLRIRVIRAVEGGMSRNGAARHFGVSIASTVRWMDDCRHTGRIGAQRDFLMAAIEEAPDITLAKLRDRLICESGETFGVSTIHDFSAAKAYP
ncbi:IS630 transposase-related protein [Ruegeria aquimaris]|uniref:IS630 transposase-related protein n=1 Tax=Ruegeria aquimaris TaxID=2984333 RepID=UPI00384B002E